MMNMTEKDPMFGLGPNQRMILTILKRHPNLTGQELASRVYQKKITTKDHEYQTMSKSLHKLLAKGLVERTEAQIRWRLPKR